MKALIRDNLHRVRAAIHEAAHSAGRDPDEIRLIGVSKYVQPDAARALFELGCSDLGESRPQELWSKSAALADVAIRWHAIGHLQRNKVRRTLPLVELIHAGDSMRLVATIDQHAAELGLQPKLLLEVNISGEKAKHGFSPEDLQRELESIAELRHIEVVGLMAMSSREGGPQQARRDFAAVRQLMELLRSEAPSNIRLQELSIGMSGDFEQAIAEGSTMVRLGSALWEGML